MSDSARLFVGNLSWGTTDQSLQDAFEEVSGPGSVVESKVIMDRYSGRSRGFGFVTFQSQAQASAAAEAMNGKNVEGREIRVDFASSRRE